MKEIFLLAVGIAAGIGLKSLQINPESTRTDIGYVYTPQPENVLEKKCKSSLPHEDGGSGSQSLPRFFSLFSEKSENCVDSGGEIEYSTVVNTRVEQSNQHLLASGDGLSARRPFYSTGVFTPPDTFCIESLLDAIEQVESGGRADAVGDGGQAIGIMQLWPVYVQDANRIAGTSYTLDDRWCPVKSREITRIVLTHYGKGMPEDKWAVIHISPSKRMDWDRPASVEYLRKINEVIK